MLLKKLNAAKMIYKQIVQLISEKDTYKAIVNALESAGKYMNADRVYILKERGELYVNTYEWRAENYSNSANPLCGFRKKNIVQWLNTMKKGSSIVVPDTTELKETLPMIYSTLSRHNIASVVAVPVITENELTGIIIADNVSPELIKEKSRFLSTLSFFIGIAIKNQRDHEIFVKSLETVKQSRNMQDELVNSAGSGIFAYTLPERKILILNSEAKRLFDCDEDDGGNETNYDITAIMRKKIPPKDFEGMRTPVKRLKKPGDSARYTFHIQKDDGERLTVSCSSKLLRFPDGQLYILSTMTDITSREMLEENLIEERKQYRDALTMNSEFTFATDLTDGHIYRPVVTGNSEETAVAEAYAASATYEELMDTWLGRRGAVFITPNADYVMSREKLISLHKSGVTHFSAECYIPCGMKYYSILILTSESKTEAGHINANVIVFNVTAEKLAEARDRSIIDSLSVVYYRVYHCSVENNKCDVIKGRQDNEEGLPYDGTLTDFANVYATQIAAAPFRDDVRDFMDISTLNERFADTDILSLEYRRRSVGWCRATMVASERKPDGSVASLILAISNIEEQKQRELQAAYDLRQQLLITKSFSEIYFASWVADIENNTLTEINVPDFDKSIVEKHGKNLREAFGYIVSSFISEEYAEFMCEFLNIDTLRKRIGDREIVSCEYKGLSGWRRANFIPIDDGSDRFIFAVQKIGEEKEKENKTKQALEQAYEAARKANLAKTDFLSNMSHDIRTPMNAIIGMTAIAGAHLDDKERVADCLNKITVSSKHLLGLINEVLDMSKIESGKLSLQDEAFSLSELVDELLVMCKPQIDGKNHELSVTVRNITHENVSGDSQRIQQVFMNMMSNAIKYTHNGGKIRLTVSEKPTNRQNIGCYEFIFEDNGIGMSSEFIERIFEPFERAHDSEVEKIQGTGLGMSISRNIVQMMNGDIKVESKLGEGTKITVTIFLKFAENADIIDFGSLVELPVLVTDDDITACESTCQILGDLGMNGEWVLTGREAVERCVARHTAGEDFFAVILDWKMPEMDGIATTKEIRRQIGDSVPIIIISAYDWSDIEQEARAAGANAFISKPFFKSRLAHLFNELLGHEKEQLRETGIEALSKEQYNGKKALLVEDNELNAEIAGELLGMTGIIVEYAPDGKQAADMVASAGDNYYDLIFMDIQMPVMNGYEAAKTIRAMDSEYAKKIPIIAMTANAFAEDVRLALEAGMNEHIAKPLDMGNLVKALRKWL